MSLKAWARLVLRRFPRARHAHNLALLCDLYNVVTRHEARPRLVHQCAAMARSRCRKSPDRR